MNQVSSTHRDSRFQRDLFTSEDVQAWRQQMVRRVLQALLFVGLLAAAAGTYEGYIKQDYWVIPFYWGIYALVIVLALWRRAPYSLQAGGVLISAYALGLLAFLTGGLGDSGRVYLLTIPFAAGLFFGLTEGIIALVVILLSMAGLGWAFSAGLITDYEEVVSTDPTLWLAGTFVLLMLGTFILVSLNYLTSRFITALTQTRSLATELEQSQTELEDQVEERTAELARRSTQLEAAAQIARDAAAIQDVEQLLKETVHLVSDRFGFYHTGIFMLDEAGQYAVLRAASSEGGQRMLARGHRLRVGQVGIVGHVAEHGEPRIALDVGEDAMFFDNPDLPETRSEIGLPLQARGEIIGALDVQSDEPQAFSGEDAAVLQTLADQVAIAISNARLFRQAQESLEAERRAYGELSREAWWELLRARPGLRQRYDPHNVLPADGRWREEMKQAVRRKEMVAGDGGPTVTLAMPVTVRGQVIGVLDAHKPADGGEWTAEEMVLLETLVDQLSVALDSARLYEEAQRRALQEQVMGEVSTRMRETLDVDAVLRTAVYEMRQALELHDVTIRLEEDDGAKKAQHSEEGLS